MRDAHWLIAQREILASSLEGFGRVTVLQMRDEVGAALGAVR